MQNLPKINLFLTCLLLIGLLSLFFLNFRILQTQNFNEKRIDALEMRPISSNSSAVIPQAGESASLDTKYLDQVISEKVNGLLSQKSEQSSPTATLKPLVTPLPTKTSKTTTYLPIFGGGFATTSTNWVDAPGSNFQFNISDYGSGVYATWDSYMWIQGGSGEVHARLFDVTNGVAVQGSEIIGTASSVTLVSSGKLIFFSGNNTYKVQIQSKTSSTVQFDNARLKILY